MYEVNPSFFDHIDLDQAMYLLNRYNYIRRKENEETQRQIEQMRAKYE